MTITVTNIVAGPFASTGLAQNLPFDFKVFTPSEVEVLSGVGASQVTISPALYSVSINKELDGQVKEGGSINLIGGAVPTGASIRVIAKPRMTQEQIYTDTGSRLKNLNEGLDRSALRALRAAYDGAQQGASAELIAEAIEAGTTAGETAGTAAAEAAVGNRMLRDGTDAEPDFPTNAGIADKDLLNVLYKRLGTGTVSLPILEMLNAQPPTPQDYGALADQEGGVFTVSIALGSYTLSVPGASFGPDMVGKLISIPKAGGGPKGHRTLLTRVTAVPFSTALTLAHSAAKALSSVSVRLTWATDDSDALQSMLDNTLPGLAPCRLNRVYHVSEKIYIRRWRTLEGCVSVGQILNRTAFNTRNGMIIIWPGGELVPLNGCAVRRLTIIGADAGINPPTPGLGLPEAEDAWDRITGWTGTAFKAMKIDETAPASRDGAMDMEISDCTIIGFEKAIKLDNIARWSLLNLKIDCLNGLEISNTYDTGRCLNLHMWGFWNGNYAHGVPMPICDTRPGTGIHLHTGVDGSLFNTALIFGWKTCIHLEGRDKGTAESPTHVGIYACQFVDYWIDNRYDAIDADYKPIGILTEYECRETTFTAIHIDAQDIGARFNHLNNKAGISLSNVTCGLMKSRLFDFVSGNGIMDGVMMGGAYGEAAFYFGTNHGHWLIDNVLAEDLATPHLFYQPDPIMRRRIKIGAVTTRNAPAFNLRIWTPHALAKKSSVQTISAATETQVVFAKTAGGADSLGEWDDTQSAYYASRAGFYIINVAVDFQAASATLSGFQLFLYNQAGTKVATLAADLTTDTYNRVYAGSWVHYMEPGDVVFARVFSNVGGQINAGQSQLTVNILGQA